MTIQEIEALYEAAEVVPPYLIRFIWGHLSNQEKKDFKSYIQSLDTDNEGKVETFLLLTVKQ